ncbi:MAG: hypothetical protein M3Z04_15980 [Chloroflexota bacterium]|nr:hypothetical protein [Chloroflexota bacterium]
MVTQNCSWQIVYRLLFLIVLTGCSTVASPQPSTPSTRVVAGVPIIIDHVGSRLGLPNDNLTVAATPITLIETPLSSPSPVAEETPGALETNITQAEYMQALTKWQVRHISDYIITVEDAGGPASLGKVQLHIKIVNGESQVVGYVDLNGDQPKVIPMDTLSAYDRDLLQGLSVEQLFHLVGTVFTSKEMVPADYSIYYEIVFDPILGYPTYVSVGSFVKGVLANDSTGGYEVTGLQILKSSAPGMSKTGHPSP